MVEAEGQLAAFALCPTNCVLILWRENYPAWQFSNVTFLRDDVLSGMEIKNSWIAHIALPTFITC